MKSFQVKENVPYVIKCVKNQRKVIDTPGFYKEKMIIYERHNGLNQQYFFKPRAEGTYVIQTMSNQAILKVHSGKVSLDQVVVGGSQQKQKNQLWRLVPALNELQYIGRKAYFIIHHSSGLMLSLKNGKINDKTQLTVWTPVGHDAQVFIIEEAQNFKK